MNIYLGKHFEEYIDMQIKSGRYKNASEVIRAGLRLLEEEEQKYYVLKTAIQEGIDSGIAVNFDPKENLKRLKLERSKNV